MTSNTRINTTPNRPIDREPRVEGSPMQVMVIYGTRPEAVKMAPLIRALKNSRTLAPLVVSTGQHREMLDQVNAWFRVQPDVDLEVLQQGASLSELSEHILSKLPQVLTAHRPDAVVVQGDTTTVAMAAITCFYHRIPVVHLEAGLRSNDISSPFPEEGNRKIVAQVAALHLAPTSRARENLLQEGIDPAKISVVGNTVIDALQWTSQQQVVFSDTRLAALARQDSRIVLFTTHRRENLGEPMQRIGRAVASLANSHPEITFISPLHRNPKVREVLRPLLEGLPNVLLCEPLDYAEFVHLQKRSHLILTDSGGVQEEAPSLGRPVLVLRENTERPEAVTAGTVQLVGTETDRIVEETERLLNDESAYRSMAHAVNPYGDGSAAERSVAAIAELLGVGRRMQEFGDESVGAVHRGDYAR